jgi:lysine 2,3-aminomutase
VEDLRTSLREGLEVEKRVRGVTAGFHTPAFVVDTMGGGGKRDAHSYEHYDREHGIAVFASPSVKPGQQFFYFDPLASLDQEVRRRWLSEGEPQRIVEEALRRAELESGSPAGVFSRA